MAAVRSRRNVIKGVALRSLPAAPTFRDIGCVRCVKRLEKNLGHRCVRKAGMTKCNYCRGQHYKCVPMPRFFWSTAHALATDAAAIAAIRKPDAGILRALCSRIRGFRKRIERRSRVSASPITIKGSEVFRAEMVVQVTRIADYLARLADVPPEAEEEDGDYLDSTDEDVSGWDEDEDE